MATAAAFEARCLVRAASSATLATSAEGQPFASLVTPAAAPDLSVLLWLSTLAEHTRHLMAEPRCALLFQGASTGPNPQTTPRVTLTGLAERIEDPALKARWLARHPYAALYADFADFALWRITPGGALLVGGFARAQRLRAAQLLPDPEAVALVAAAEASVIEHMNQDHAAAVGRIAQKLGGQPGAASSPWQLTNLDPDGCDVSDGETCLRLAFTAQVGSIAALRQELVTASTVQ
jgi:putative heme iron utilization protein